ncbi:hypothetical protein GCM10009539_06610 [Cryptosporangium japonicum]|uniref:Protein kinase domain-containing protein n=2 Tax=Cryptosporangium japonicum TaxID=80872 RepID=A0ABN0TKN2_9ACTN
MVKAAQRLARMHEVGSVHGDLKPDNILLGASGPILIDHFALQIGGISPGWTPEWSAPEQVLGLPVSAASDIYSLGVMISRLTGATLVGEVRKLRTLPTADGDTEFDVFYNPIPALPPGRATQDPASFRAWSRLATRCLRFDPDQRITTAEELVERLNELIAEHPLTGFLKVTLPGRLAVATLIDGSTTVVRLLEDFQSRQKPSHAI